ncbi:hypothetical protein METHP14_30170 [Pseudomonas sp. P14-2025]
MGAGPCRSGFTRECSGEFDIAFAGKPAPTGAQYKPSGKFRAKKTPDFVWGGGSSGSKSGPLGRGPDICQHLTQHRSIEGLHQPFSYSEFRFTGLVPKPTKLFAIVS